MASGTILDLSNSYFFMSVFQKGQYYEQPWHSSHSIQKMPEICIPQDMSRNPKFVPILNLMWKSQKLDLSKTQNLLPAPNKSVFSWLLMVWNCEKRDLWARHCYACKPRLGLRNPWAAIMAPDMSNNWGKWWKRHWIWAIIRLNGIWDHLRPIKLVLFHVRFSQGTILWAAVTQFSLYTENVRDMHPSRHVTEP